MPYKDILKRKECEANWRAKNREIIKIKSRLYRKNHPDKARETKRKYYLTHKDTVKAWKMRNSEKVKEYNRRWAGRNKEIKREKLKLWRKNNPDKVRNWAEKNREKINGYGKKRRTKVSNRISHAIGGQIYESIKEKKAGRCWEQLLGYTIKDLIIHLESRFGDNMNWNNYGSYWSIDHIRPRNWFNFESVEDEEFKKCWDLNNLQPMSNKDNYSKGDRFIG